jgi:ribonuclease D
VSEQPESEATVELPLLTKPRAKVHYLSTENQLEQAVMELKAAKGQIAIDAERASGFKYSQRAYLVQLKAAGSEIFLIDPVSVPETTESKQFRELSAVLADRQWILHAATQDLSCLAEIGLTPGAIFDTELAARLAGQPRVGLGSLTESLLQFRLAKEHSAADWSTRPLPESWLTYAALDVDVLHELSDAVNGLLLQQQKISWAEQEFDALLRFKPKPQKPERWRGVSGVHKITDRLSLEIVRQLWLAREQLGQKMDVAPGRLIPDPSILAVALEKPRTKPELSSMKNFTGRASRSYIGTWWDALQHAYRATDLPAIRPEKTDSIPNHRNWASKFPDADKRYRNAKQALADLAEKNKLPLENLLSPDILRQLCFTPPSEPSTAKIARRLQELGARSWQVELTAKLLEASFIQQSEPIALTAESPLE